MRKIMILLGLASIGYCSQAASRYGLEGAVIKYDNQLLVIERGRPANDQERSFIFHRDGLKTAHLYEIKNPGSDEALIVRDTIKAISSLVYKAFPSFDSDLYTNIYKIWKKGGQKTSYERDYSDGYNSWLTQNTIRSVKTTIYYDHESREIKADSEETSRSRFSWENIVLFLALFFVSIKTRNVFRNCGKVSLVLVAALYLGVGIAFLGSWAIVSKSPDIFIIVLVSIFSLIAMVANDYYSLFLFLSKKKNKKGTRLKFIVTIGMSLLIGGVISFNLGYYQFLVLSLSAGSAAYFFPFWKGKRNPKRKFVIPSSDKLEA